jgi:hypothetical protein
MAPSCTHRNPHGRSPQVGTARRRSGAWCVRGGLGAGDGGDPMDEPRPHGRIAEEGHAGVGRVAPSWGDGPVPSGVVGPPLVAQAWASPHGQPITPCASHGGRGDGVAGGGPGIAGAVSLTARARRGGVPPRRREEDASPQGRMGLRRDPVSDWWPTLMSQGLGPWPEARCRGGGLGSPGPPPIRADERTPHTPRHEVVALPHF